MHENIKKFIALALQQKDEIEPAFLKLKKELLAKYGKRIKPFIDYYQYTWIEVYGVETFCVYDEEVRTNNSIEAYHRVLNGYLTSSLSASAFISKKII